ncbi:mechanosensitive ion channel family protein [Halapricum hydrolyticum]|uniref:Mechanosensitive ion channel family protein n=1 Tax=Halapricum hydrolyticum TaxID=2979991 RepID=A0AAE3IEM3_9EURY|nr:mechanosensitive ion channel domain-containing protein [Halapricum hydrolyticum]MCU4718969.1 mechanosensitive ion channel family protein [Halapricum hydrolyticum]MCU4727898.1 mechanosensitive ion channel family protein [Halapricum hydrolyticum]
MFGVPIAAITVESILESFRADLAGAIPRVISGLLFLVIAYLGIKIATAVLRSVIGQVYGGQALIADLFVLIVVVFLWFGAGLTFLSILGLGAIAASLGTAAGFIALGVSYALSNMIADTVAGVYLLRDPDFNPGDTVTTESVTGTVESIGLRKSRLRLDSGELVVLANRNVESRWTWQSSPE